MSMEGKLAMPTAKVEVKGDPKDLDVLGIEQKLEALKAEVATLEKKDKDISTGEGFRVKTKDGSNPIEMDILAKEDEIRKLEKEKKVAVKKVDINKLKEEIKALEGKYKNRITGRDGFLDKDLKEDPIEKEILEKEAQIRALEGEVKSILNEKVVAKNNKVAADSGKSKSETNFSNTKQDQEDFEYAGVSEGFGEKGTELPVDRMAERGTEGVRGEILDSESFGNENATENGTEAREKSREELMMEQGYQLADGLTEVFGQLPENDRQRRDFEILVQFEGNGRSLFESLIESLEDDVKREGLSEDQKLERLQTQIDIIAVLKDKADKFLEQSKEPEEHFGSEGENIQGLQEGRNRKEMGTYESRIAELKLEIENARKEYLKVDLEKNTAFKRLGKFFGNIGKYSEERNLENDSDLAWYRAQYDNKLFDLQKLQMEEAKANGASNEQLADIYGGFLKEQRVTMADEHDKVKIEHNDGSIWGSIKNKVNAIGKGYNELSPTKRRAIGIALMGFGAATGIAGASVAAVASFSVARRLFSGMTSGLGMATGLEARGQMKDEEKVNLDKAAFLEQIKNMSEEQKFALLSGNVKNIAIRDNENMINRIKNQDIRQLTAGVAWGTFIGSGAMGSILKWGTEKTGITEFIKNIYQHGADFFQGHSNFGVHTAPGSFGENNFAPGPHTEYPLEEVQKIPVHHEMGTQTGSPEYDPNGGVTSVVEHNIDQHNLDIKASIDRIKHDFVDVHDQALLKTDMEQVLNDLQKAGVDQEHLESFRKDLTRAIESGGKLGDIQVTFDSHGGIASFSYNLEAGYPIGEGVSDHVQTGSPEFDPNAGPAQTVEQAPTNTVSYDPEHDYHKIEAEMSKENEINALNEKYSGAADDALRNPANGDGPSIDQYEKMGSIDDARKDATRILGEMRAEDVPWKGLDSLDSLLENHAGPKQLLKASLDKITTGSVDKLAMWNEIKNQSFEVASFDNSGNPKEAMWYVVDEYHDLLGNKALPLENEKVGAWLARVVKLSLEKGK